MAMGHCLDRQENTLSPTHSYMASLECESEVACICTFYIQISTTKRRVHVIPTPSVNRVIDQDDDTTHRWTNVGRPRNTTQLGL